MAPRAQLAVIDPSTEAVVTSISLGSADDVDRAVNAARGAFEGWGETTKEQRLEHLERLVAVYERRQAEMAQAISTEMGAPMTMALTQQAAAGLGHLKAANRVLRDFEFGETPLPGAKPGSHERIVHEPVGVCGLICPWNWPMNQVALKVAPALAAGCTVVLKPSEIAPLSSLLFAEMVDEAGFPPGVFNLVNGDGATVGHELASHPGVDMVSFTGSTRAGVAVTKAAADTVKKVALELGGKGANLIFADLGDGLEKAVKRGVAHCFHNTGQSCNAPSRMLVEASVYDRAVEIAREAGRKARVGLPSEEGSHIGPLVSQAQYDKVQDLIASGVAEGSTLLCGGPGKPEGFGRGYYAKPTIFADVAPTARTSREEIFGPVLSILKFGDEAHAVQLANDTPYGLTNYVQSSDPARVRRLARALKAGMVEANGKGGTPIRPFGGIRQSGNGREGGVWGMLEFLEVKAITGWPDEES